jgi:hypothetical protein
VQEPLFAKDIMILCKGRVWVDWGRMRTINKGYMTSLRRPRKYTVDVDHALRLTMMQKVRKHPLLDALRLFGQSECADPRDKVYGLMGIEHETQRVVVDYSKAVCDVYLDTAIAILELDKQVPWTIQQRGNGPKDGLQQLANDMGFSEDQLEGL